MRDRLPAGLEGIGELVLAELEAADPGQDLGVVGSEPAGRLERLVGRRIEGRIGRLADALEEREPEIALGVRVRRVGGDECLEAAISATVREVAGGGELGGGGRRTPSEDAGRSAGSATAMAGSRRRSRRSPGPTQGAWSTGASRRSWPWYGRAPATDDPRA